MSTDKSIPNFGAKQEKPEPETFPKEAFSMREPDFTKAREDLTQAAEDIAEAKEDLARAKAEIKAAFSGGPSAFSPEATGERMPGTSVFTTEPNQPISNGTFGNVHAFGTYIIPQTPRRRGTNFGLLAWAFIMVTVGILLWSIPFLNKVEPIMLAIVASGSIGFVLLITAITVALVERKRDRNS